MIEQIKIDNFALIKSLELSFSNGFNVLLGETGAGKSIILGALNFVLGGKADKSIIRSGEEMAKVSAMFSSQNEKVGKLLESFGLEESEEILIYRSFSSQGKSEVRINGQFATVGMLREQLMQGIHNLTYACIVFAVFALTMILISKPTGGRKK